MTVETTALVAIKGSLAVTAAKAAALVVQLTLTARSHPQLSHVATVVNRAEGRHVTHATDVSYHVRQGGCVLSAKYPCQPTNVRDTSACITFAVVAASNTTDRHTSAS